MRSWKGINPDVLFAAGVEVDPDGSLVRIPYRRRDGSVHRWRYVGSRGRRWWGAGDGLIPLGLETLPDPRAGSSWTVIIAEGESDTLAIREAYAGLDVAAIGVPGATCWRAAWRSHLKPFPVVYVAADGDEAGHRLKEAILSDVPWCRPLAIPAGADARSLLQTLGPRALDPFLLRADRVDRAWWAIHHATSVEEFVALVRGEEVARAA